MSKFVEGTYAAVITPRDQDGELEEDKFRDWLLFLMDRGIRGFAINGATGEFCLTNPRQFERLMSIAREVTRGRANFVAGIGGASFSDVTRLGRIAKEGGAAGVLLPMPYFFPYPQCDLSVFCRDVAIRLDVPILLYNLPQFTSGLEPDTSLSLIRECDAIVGIKDSSGSLDTLRLLTREEVDACRIIGNDGALAGALAENICDGVVSGVACVLPELMLQLYETGYRDTQQEDFRDMAAQLARFIEAIDSFPTPWGLKIIGEQRALLSPTFPLPLSLERTEQWAKLSAWFAENRSDLMVERVKV